ncbi:hypothetical protein MRY82_10430 [bacterium]|nr:hypothetical protein [bacterium]
MNLTLFRNCFFALSTLAFVGFAQNRASFVKGDVPTEQFIKQLTGSYEVIDTDTNKHCPLSLGDTFVITYTTQFHMGNQSVGVFKIHTDTTSEDRFYLGQKNLPQDNADQRVWTGVKSSIDEDAKRMSRVVARYSANTQSWTKTHLSFDFSYAPGTYLQVRQSSAQCNSFEDDLPVWNGGSSEKLPDSCEFIEVGDIDIPPPFYCLGKKLAFSSVHASE